MNNWKCYWLLRWPTYILITKTLTTRRLYIFFLGYMNVLLNSDANLKKSISPNGKRQWACHRQNRANNKNDRVPRCWQRDSNSTDLRCNGIKWKITQNEVTVGVKNVRSRNSSIQECEWTLKMWWNHRDGIQMEKKPFEMTKGNLKIACQDVCIPHWIITYTHIHTSSRIDHQTYYYRKISRLDYLINVYKSRWYAFFICFWSVMRCAQQLPPVSISKCLCRLWVT